jgi:uncharacterized membrane protein
MLRRLCRRRRRTNESGAILPMIAVMSMTLVLMAGFAVDLGMQRVGRRDMQALTDVVALDMARLLDGRSASSISSDPAWTAALNQSVARNDRTVGTAPVVGYTLGEVNGTTGVFTAMTGSSIPTAVKITASTDVDFAFYGNRGNATRSSVAAVAIPSCAATCNNSSNAFACFSIGSFAINLASSNSLLLNQILGDALNTSVLSYSGLAGTRVKLDALDTALGLGSPSDIATAKVSVANFLTAIATVLNQQGGSAAQVTLLNSIKAGLTSAMQGTLLNLADIISVGAGNSSALDATVNVLDLVSGAAFVANGNNFISVPGLSLSIPNVTSLTMKLYVIEKPQIACGRPGQNPAASANTSQVSLTLSGNLGGSFTGGTVKVANTTFTTTVNLANAKGSLTGMTCTNGVAQSLNVGVTNQTLASIRLQLNMSLLNLLGISLAGVAADVTNSQTGGNSTGSYTLGIPAAYSTPVQTTSGSLNLQNLTASQLTITGLGLGITLNTNSLLSSVINPLVTNLNSTVTSLASSLGMTVAGADLWALRTPACSTPILVGTT